MSAEIEVHARNDTDVWGDRHSVRYPRHAVVTLDQIGLVTADYDGSYHIDGEGFTSVVAWFPMDAPVESLVKFAEDNPEGSVNWERETGPDGDVLVVRWVGCV